MKHLGQCHFALTNQWDWLGTYIEHKISHWNLEHVENVILFLFLFFFSYSIGGKYIDLAFLANMFIYMVIIMLDQCYNDTKEYD